MKEWQTKSNEIKYDYLCKTWGTTIANYILNGGTIETISIKGTFPLIVAPYYENKSQFTFCTQKSQTFLKALAVFYWKHKMLLSDAYSINFSFEGALTIAGMSYMPGVIVANNYIEGKREIQWVNDNLGKSKGWDGSLGVSLTNYYYTGKPEDFSIDVFQGEWTSISIGAACVEAGITWFPYNLNGSTIGWVFGVTGSFEISPNIVSGNITFGETYW